MRRHLAAVHDSAGAARRLLEQAHEWRPSVVRHVFDTLDLQPSDLQCLQLPAASLHSSCGRADAAANGPPAGALPPSTEPRAAPSMTTPVTVCAASRAENAGPSIPLPCFGDIELEHDIELERELYGERDVLVSSTPLAPELDDHIELEQALSEPSVPADSEV